MLSVLLGAGASYEAGLPLATQLTDRIIDSIEPFHQPLLQFVRSTMQAQRAALVAQGKFPRSSSFGIDSEALYNTVQDLVHRDQLDVSPFVFTWHPLLTQFGPTVGPEQIANPLQRAINMPAQEVYSALRSQSGNPYTMRRSSPSPEVRSAANAIQEMVRGRPLDDNILSLIQGQVLEHVSVAQDTPLDYLAPLLRILRDEPTLVIGTLNYDVTIEELCSRNSVECSDGINGEILGFPNSGVNLYKLHGSTSWARRNGRSVEHVQDAGGYERVVRFGGRNKLTAEWPFFELFWHWREALNNADTLWIIGYSFRDDHINAVIENWFASDENRRAVIVDPGFQQPERQIFGGALYSASTDTMTPSPQAAPTPLSNDDVRIAIVRYGAGEALEHLAEQYPNLPIDFARSKRG